MGLYAHLSSHICSVSYLEYYFKWVWIIQQNCRVRDYSQLNLLLCSPCPFRAQMGRAGNACQHVRMNEYVWSGVSAETMNGSVKISVKMEWTGIISSTKSFSFPFSHQEPFFFLLQRESNTFHFLWQVQSKQTPSLRRTLVRQEGIRNLGSPSALLSKRRDHRPRANIRDAKARWPGFKSQVICLIAWRTLYVVYLFIYYVRWT